jgi:hypothetical protein
MHRRVSAPQHVSVFLNGSGTAVPFNINDGLAGQRFGIARLRGERGHLLQRRVAAGALLGEIDLGDGDQDLGAGLQIRLCVPKTLYGAYRCRGESVGAVEAFCHVTRSHLRQ